MTGLSLTGTRLLAAGGVETGEMGLRAGTTVAGATLVIQMEVPVRVVSRLYSRPRYPSPPHPSCRLRQHLLLPLRQDLAVW